MKRKHTILLWIGIIAIFLVGCGGDISSEAEPSQPETIDNQLALTLAVPLPSYYTDLSDVLDRSFTDQASSFSVDGVSCEVTYVTYADLLGLQRLLLSDSPPDLILFSVNQYDADMPCEQTLRKRGYLLDLEPFVQNDASLAARPFLSSYYEAMYKSNDGLYTLSYQFYLRTLNGASDQLGSESGWSMEMFLDRAAELTSETKYMLPYGPTSALNALIQADLYDFVDLESGTCSFDSDKFERLLVFCKSNDGTGNSPAVLTPMTIFRGLNELVPDGSRVYIGYPGVSGNGALLETGDTLGICSLSSEKDLAWEFIKSYLSVEYQRDNTGPFWPVIQSDFEYCLQKREDSDAQKELVRDLIYNADTRSLMYHPIVEIVNEEAASFFNGDKPSDQVIKTIQSRAEIYLAENSDS